MFELRLICPEDRVEPLSDALEALEALSVSVEDADADTDAERALFGEPGLPPPAQSWSRSRMVPCSATRRRRAMPPGCWRCRTSGKVARWRRSRPCPNRIGCA